MQTPSNIFHLALPITDIEAAREFYGTVLGLQEKRSAFNWIDFDFWGHQLSLHLVIEKYQKNESTMIDGDQVPALHYGLILEKAAWTSLKDELAAKKVRFLIGPKIRFEGKQEEQGTFFISDPFSNYIEIKYFSNKCDSGWL